MTEKTTQEARNLIEQVYNDKCAEINGHAYHYVSTTHERRLKIFSYMMGIKNKLAKDDYSFMGTPEWGEIAGLIEKLVSYEEQLIAKRKDHWEEEEFSGDYLKLMLTSLQVISYPLLRGNQ